MEGAEDDRAENFEKVYITELKIKSEPLNDDEMDTQHSEQKLLQQVVVKDEKDDENLDRLQPVCEINVKEEELVATEKGASSCTNFDEMQLEMGSLQTPESSGSSEKNNLCYVCCKYFSDQEYYNHLLQKDCIICNICGQVFYSKYNFQSLRYHVKKDHGQLPFCQYCYSFFHTTSERDQHRMSCKNCQPRDMKLTPYPCDHCLSDFDTKFVLRKHMETIHNCVLQVVQFKKKYLTTDSPCISIFEKLCKDVKYKNLKIVIFCSVCSLTYNVKKYFGSHLNTCMKNPSLKCPFCPLNSEDIFNRKLEEHIVSNHVDAFSEIHICNICKLSFFNSTNYEMHKIKMHETETCKTATLLYINRDDPKIVSNVNNTIENKPNKPKDGCYTCKKCGENVPKKLYADHLNGHVFKCPYCTLLVPSAEVIISHLGLHSNANTKCYEFFLNDPSVFNNTKVKSLAKTKTRIFLETKPRSSDELQNQCQVCYKLHQFHCKLTKHQKNMNHNVDIITCMVCSEKMCSEMLFNHHSNLHPNKGIQCTKCIQRFLTVDKFIIHFHDKHTQFEPECHLCYEIIKNESKRIKHRLKYHADGKFLCTICDSKFRLKQDLDIHRLDEHNIQRFKCKNCESLFSSRVFYEQHKYMCPV